MIKPTANIENIIPYKAGKTIEEIKRRYNIEKIIKLGSNENSLGTSPKALKAIRNFSKKANLYPDSSCYELIKKMSKILDVSPSNLIFGNGSNEIIELVFRAFISEGSEIISSFPTFSFYKICAKTTLGKFTEVPLKNNFIDTPQIIKHINSNTKIVILCNPNNPTGTVIGQKAIIDIISSLNDDSLLVIDEAYIEFTDKSLGIDSISLLKNFPNKNILISRTFSKIYGLSSLRIGYAVSNEYIINYLNRVRQPFNVNGFAQAAALEALDDTAFLNKTIKTISKGKKYLYKEFSKLKINYIDSETNFIFFETKFDNDTIFEEFLKRGVIIRSLKSFGYDKALRVTIGKERENQIFIQALKNILKERDK